MLYFKEMAARTVILHSTKISHFPRSLTIMFICRHTVEDDFKCPNPRKGHIFQYREVVLHGIPLAGGLAVLEEATLGKQHQPLSLAGDVEVPEVLFKFHQRSVSVLLPLQDKRESMCCSCPKYQLPQYKIKTFLLLGSQTLLYVTSN